MLSALIPSERGQPAVPLARQLAHQRFVRPGPLVLGAAPVKPPTPTADRDRHICYLRDRDLPGDQVVSAWLCMSPCRSDHIFTVCSPPKSCLGRHGVRRVVSEDSECLHPMNPP